MVKMKRRWKIILLLFACLGYVQLELYWFASSQRQVRSQPATIAPSLLEKSFDRDTRHPWTPPAHHRAEVKVSKEVTAVPQCANFDQQQVDAKVREMPGGTELEALEERRALSEKNWPVTPVADQLWRKRARPVVDACLRSFQHSLSSGAALLIGWTWGSKQIKKSSDAIFTSPLQRILKRDREITRLSP